MNNKIFKLSVPIVFFSICSCSSNNNQINEGLPAEVVIVEDRSQSRDTSVIEKNDNKVRSVQKNNQEPKKSSGGDFGIIGSVFGLIGEVIALPFRLVGGIIDFIF